MDESPSKISHKTNWLKAKVKLNGIRVLLKYSGIIYRDSLMLALRGKVPDFDKLPLRFSEEAAEMTDAYMDFDYDFHGDFPKLEPGERGLIISNHPSDEVIWPWLRVVSQNFSPNLVAVAKKEFRFDPRTMPPFLGWPAILAGMMIPVDRRNRKSAVESIRRGCADIFAPGDAMFIFPEGHRPTPQRIQAARKKMAEKYPEENSDWLRHTAFPKSGGLMEILEATKDHPLRILNTTVAADQDEHTDAILGATVHIHSEEVQREALIDMPSGYEEREVHLRKWLLAEWERKNKMIAEWRKSFDSLSRY